ncbi:MAG: PadR family transcriptional regulator [Aeromicrobium sp.]|uniref:PadR family transcriptional regulator n=1 Tax=Aeromicrobium sp. TaxID=1871063 RepID=UPI0039E3FA8D
MPESAEDELLDELHRGWLEVYKKSMTTLVLLRIVAEGPTRTDDAAAAFTESTGWPLTERGLYRTLKRLTDCGFLEVTRHPGRRTGAARHEYALTDRGRRHLARLESSLVA